MQSYFEEHVRRMTMQVRIDTIPNSNPVPERFYSKAKSELCTFSALELEVLGVLQPDGTSPRFLQQRRRPARVHGRHERRGAVVGEPAPEARPAAADGPGIVEAGRRADSSLGAAGRTARGGRGHRDHFADCLAFEETESVARLRRGARA